MSPAEQDRPDCLHCVHYFVTWESDRPRGCRAYQFKSNELPSDVVLASSGERCALFERKPGPRRKAQLLR
jgi:hypothetical protein